VFLEEASIFLDSLEEHVKRKILYNITTAQIAQDKSFFKKLSRDIWEFRTLYNGIHYRLFAFWDKTGNSNTLVISTHGYVKKSNKIPRIEILKAIQWRRIYFETKKTGK
jgi:phage-related protein